MLSTLSLCSPQMPKGSTPRHQICTVAVLISWLEVGFSRVSLGIAVLRAGVGHFLCQSQSHREGDG